MTAISISSLRFWDKSSLEDKQAPCGACLRFARGGPMDTFSLFQIIRAHSFYKTQGDALRALILSCTCDGKLDWEVFQSRLDVEAPAVLAALHQNRSRYRQLAEDCLARKCEGFQFVCFGEDLYPTEFYYMEDPPLTFTFLGAPAWLLERSLAVVGSREPREESLQWMENELGLFLETERVHIVSGGARGVDQKAHALALRKDLPTTVILPSGLGAIYPSSLEDWKPSVLAAGGCFMSEYSFAQPMQKHLFPHRNRLIAALGRMILIVEARRRSGSMISAQLAAQLGKPVLVVPGHPSDKNYSGGLDLLADGGTLVRDAQDLGLIFRSELWSQFSSAAGLDAKIRIRH